MNGGEGEYGILHSNTKTLFFDRQFWPIRKKKVVFFVLTIAAGVENPLGANRACIQSNLAEAI